MRHGIWITITAAWALCRFITSFASCNPTRRAGSLRTWSPICPTGSHKILAYVPVSWLRAAPTLWMAARATGGWWDSTRVVCFWWGGAQGDWDTWWVLEEDPHGRWVDSREHVNACAFRWVEWPGFMSQGESLSFRLGISLVFFG